MVCLWKFDAEEVLGSMRFSQSLLKYLDNVLMTMEKHTESKNESNTEILPVYVQYSMWLKLWIDNVM